MSNMSSPDSQPAWKNPVVIIGGVIIVVALLVGVAAASGMFSGAEPTPIPPTAAPLPTTPPNEPVTPAISILEPANGATLDIANPVRVAGEGQGLPEGNVVVQAVDAGGNTLAQVTTTLRGKDVGTGGKGDWEVELDLTEVIPGLKGSIVAFGTDPKTGDRLAETRIDVTFGEPVAAMIRIDEPANGAVLDITQPVRVAGEGQGLFEGNVVVQAVDVTGAVLADANAVLEGEDAGVGGKGAWSVDLDLSHVAPGTKGRIVAFGSDPKTGERIAEVSVDVTFGEKDAEAPSTLEGPLWLLTLIDGAQPLEGASVYVIFDEGKVSGSAGCNTFNGSYTSDASNLHIEALMTTRKACDEPEGVMEQEQAFLQHLQSAASYSTSNGLLTITTADGSPALTFAPAVGGELTYKARIALPETAQVIITLEDVSKGDSSAQVIGQTIMKAPVGPPIPFAVTYNLKDIDPERTYAVRAQIKDANGALLFTSDQAYHVITQGNPSYVTIELVQP